MYEQLTIFNYMIFDDVPPGWVVIDGAPPRIGCRWISNNKSRFGGEYRHALVAEDKAIEWQHNRSRQGNSEESPRTCTA